MSQETATWLNTQTLIGNTDKRGHAWHYRADEQGSESNHYPGFVPVGDVIRRLFAWEAITAPVEATLITSEGVRRVTDPTRFVTARSDTGVILGVGSDTRATHQFGEWLLGAVSNMIGDTLGVSSAGLLKAGAIAWVEVSIPDTLTTPEGVTFRPNLLATTAHDGSIATTYKRTAQDTVCDNTRAVALAGAGESFRVKHTRNSGLRLAEAREALSLITETADAFSAQVKALCETTVTDPEWFRFLDAYAPVPADEGRSHTMATNKRDALTSLYRNDPRCAPWNGTAHGVVQTVNTWAHHVSIVRNADRAERNMLNAITGKTDALDADVWSTLSKVLANV